MNHLPGTDAFNDHVERIRARHYMEMNRQLAAAGVPGKFLAIELGDALVVSQAENLRLMCLRAQDAPRLEEYEALAAGHDLTPLIDLLPLRANEPVLETLQARGYGMYRWHAMLWGDATELAPAETPNVEPVTEANLAEFIETFMRGYGIPPAELDAERPTVNARFAAGDWRLYLARIAGQPAAAGALAYVGGHARLANGCTLPEFRGRGLQTQLLHARLRQAAADGHRLVVSDAQMDSSSMRNMLRVGMRMACQMTGWKRIAP